LIIEEYNHTPAQEPVDTTQNPPVDTIPDNPPPVDTIPDNPPPVDTIPDNPPPVDTIPDNPPPIDTIPDNPPPVDTIPDNPPPVDTIPDNPPPVDTIPDNPPPVDSLPEQATGEIKAYPNPFKNEVQLLFYNGSATGKISIDIHDTYGRLIYRQDYGPRAVGNNIIVINGFSSNLRIGMYLLSLKVDGKRVRTIKLIKKGY
jgi:hypothetical protein